jgi:hypothetical protein
MSDDETPDWWKPYARECPGWHAWRGVNMLYYARLPKTSPPVVVRGEDPEDLRDMIKAAETDLDGWRNSR